MLESPHDIKVVVFLARKPATSVAHVALLTGQGNYARDVLLTSTNIISFHLSCLFQMLGPRLTESSCHKSLPPLVLTWYQAGPNLQEVAFDDTGLHEVVNRVGDVYGCLAV